MKKYIFSIVFMGLGYISCAQNLTMPEIIGYQTGRTMTVNFPFSVKAIPFANIPGSVWHKNSVIVAELYMSYYMQGDQTKYGNKVVKRTNLTSNGDWTINDLTIEPHPYYKPEVKMVEGKTTYSLFIFQEHNGKLSSGWNALVYRTDLKPMVNKIPDQMKGPKVVLPKDKVILNPQPIPPKEIKKKLKGNL